MSRDYNVIIPACLGEKQYKFEEILPIFKAVSDETDTGTFADFMEAFKTFDREGQGFVAAAELRHVLTSLGKYSYLVLLRLIKFGMAYGISQIVDPFLHLGERLSDADVDSILKFTGTEEDLDGNIKYEGE